MSLAGSGGATAASGPPRPPPALVPAKTSRTQRRRNHKAAKEAQKEAVAANRPVIYQPVYISKPVVMAPKRKERVSSGGEIICYFISFFLPPVRSGDFLVPSTIRRWLTRLQVGLFL